MPSEIPSSESADSLPDEVVGNLVQDLLLSFFATHGANCELRFEEDVTFRQLLLVQCMHTLGVVAAVMSWRDESLFTCGIAVDSIANAMHDTSEVAALRVFTLKNMVPKEALERPEISARVRWFLDGYQRNRGAALAITGH